MNNYFNLFLIHTKYFFNKPIKPCQDDRDKENT